MSAQMPELVREIKTLGFDVVESKVIENLPFCERDHADMQMLKIESKIFLLNICKDLLPIIQNPESEIILTSDEYKYTYPDSIKLNCAIVGKKILCKSNYTDSSVVNFCKKSGYSFINVNQGYAKCSTIVVNENAIITADNSISTAAIKNGIDVLKIKQGYINLKGTDYGFIGGCCGVINKQIIFTGNLKKHPDYFNIKNFCNNYKMDIICLTNKELLDIGGIISF